MSTAIKLSFEQVSDSLDLNELWVTAVRVTSAVCELQVLDEGRITHTIEIHPFPTEFRIKEILRKLESCTSLQKVTVGTKSRAPMLARSKSMQRLLPVSQLTDLAMESFHWDNSTVTFGSIADAAMQCPTLQRLSLSHCKMDRLSRNQFLSLLQNHPGLAALHVGDGNEFGEELAPLLTHLAHQGRLRELSFTVPEFDHQDRELLLQALQENTSLENVHMVVTLAGVPLLDRNDRATIKKLCERNKLSNASTGIATVQRTLKRSQSYDDEVSSLELEPCDSNELANRFDGLVALQETIAKPESIRKQEEDEEEENLLGTLELNPPCDSNELVDRFDGLVVLQESIRKPEIQPEIHNVAVESEPELTKQEESSSNDPKPPLEEEVPLERSLHEEIAVFIQPQIVNVASKTDSSLSEPEPADHIATDNPLQTAPIRLQIGISGTDDAADSLNPNEPNDKEIVFTPSAPRVGNTTRTEKTTTKSNAPNNVVFKPKTPDTSFEDGHEEISFMPGSPALDSRKPPATSTAAKSKGRKKKKGFISKLFGRKKKA